MDTRAFESLNKSQVSKSIFFRLWIASVWPLRDIRSRVMSILTTLFFQPIPLDSCLHVTSLQLRFCFQIRLTNFFWLLDFLRLLDCPALVWTDFYQKDSNGSYNWEEEVRDQEVQFIFRLNFEIRPSCLVRQLTWQPDQIIPSLRSCSHAHD